MVVVRLPSMESRELNAVGGRVWELLDGRTTAEIVAMVLAETDAPADVVGADVEAFLDELLVAGLIAREP